MAVHIARNSETPLRRLRRLAAGTALLLAAIVPAIASGEPGNAAASRSGAASTVRDPALVLSEVQSQLGRMTGAQSAADPVEGLTSALTAARGRALEAGTIERVAAGLAAALATGSLDEESLERLAQNLYAAVNSRSLTSREVGLLTLDVSMLLKEAGAERPDVDRVTGDLQRLCGAAPAPLAGGVLAGGPSILSRP